jgi:hypothetical protein
MSFGLSGRTTLKHDFQSHKAIDGGKRNDMLKERENNSKTPTEYPV